MSVPSANCCTPPGSIVTEKASVPFFTNLNRLPAVAALQVGSPNVTFAPIVPIRISFTSVVIVEDVVTYVCGFPQLGSHVVPVHCKTCEVAADCWAIFRGTPPEPSPSKVASVVTVPPAPLAENVSVSPDKAAVTPEPSRTWTSLPVLEFRRYKVALTSVQDRFVAPPLAQLIQSHALPSHK